MCILSFGVCLYALNNESAIKVLWGHLLLHVGIVNAKKDQTRGGLHIFKYDNVQSSTSSGFYNTSRLCDRLCCKDSTTHQGCVTELCCKNTAEIELSGGARIPIDLDFVFSNTRKIYFPSLFLPEC
jgi:hypothetical protein